MTDPISSIFLELHLRFTDPLLFVPLGVVFAVLLGYLCYTDIFQDKFVPDVASLGLVFAAWAAMPFIYSDPKRMLIWALGASLFFFVVFVLGAVADGDLKIYLAYAALLGPAAIPAAFISWVAIIIYSLPIMIRAKEESGKAKGERLGVAPGVPGIAVALPATLALLGAPVLGALSLLLGIFAVAGLCWLVSRIASTKKSV